MNPYLSFGIAMCGVVLIALAGTAYMAVYFNRRAKKDLAAALQPLADAIGGEADLEEAVVSGRFDGHLAEGKIVVLPGGMGRVFSIGLVDGAGGSPWTWTLSRSREPGVPPTGAFEPHPGEIATAIEPALQPLVEDPSLANGWFRVAYDPGAGQVVLTRPMKTRRDLPDGEMFQHFLDELKRIADQNRAIQGPATVSS